MIMCRMLSVECGSLISRNHPRNGHQQRRAQPTTRKPITLAFVGTSAHQRRAIVTQECANAVAQTSVTQNCTRSKKMRKFCRELHEVLFGIAPRTPRLANPENVWECVAPLTPRDRAKFLTPGGQVHVRGRPRRHGPRAAGHQARRLHSAGSRRLECDTAALCNIGTQPITTSRSVMRLQCSKHASFEPPERNKKARLRKLKQVHRAPCRID